MLGLALTQDIKRKQDTYVLVKRVFNKWVKVLVQHGTIAVIFYRFGNFAYSFPLPVCRQLLVLLYLLFKPLIVRLSGIDINAKTPIGAGFVIHNFSDVVIDAGSIGECLTINQGVHICRDYTGRGQPLIGNNVYIGSGAKILGDIRIGNNVVIAANAVVIKNTGDNVMVAGNPGLVIARNNSADYVAAKPAHSTAGN